MTDDEHHYIQNDLIYYADPEHAARENQSDGHTTYFTGGRDDWIQSALPNADVIETTTSGGCQGKWAFVAKAGGYWWLHAEYYGTCAGCDAFIGRKMSWLDDTLRQAYCFETVEDALSYLAATDAIEWNYSEGDDIRSAVAHVLEEHRRENDERRRVLSEVHDLLDDVNPSHHHWSADDAEQAAFEKGMEVAKREFRRELDDALLDGGDTRGE